MVIRALLIDPTVEVDSSEEGSVRSILDRIDQLSRFRDAGHLRDFLDAERVAGEEVEQVSVMAKAAWMAHATEQHDPTPAAQSSVTIPGVEDLIASRDGVAIDPADGSVSIVNKSRARKLAIGLEELSDGILASARQEDRERTSSNTVA
jgi:hypothetical protein